MARGRQALGFEELDSLQVPTGLVLIDIGILVPGVRNSRWVQHTRRDDGHLRTDTDLECIKGLARSCEAQ